MTKICTECNNEKELTEFRTGRNKCKTCVASYMRQYRLDNPNYAKANLERQRERDKGKTRFSRHGTTEEEYEKLKAKYDGKCWACHFRIATNIDHDHKCCSKDYSCGKCIRGLLCTQCNTALGLMQDNPVLIQKLIDYLVQ